MSGEDVEDRFALLGTEVDGRFRVSAVVAEGGFGVVYKAVQTTLDRQVALKVLKTPARLDEVGKKHFVEKFALEAKTIARISHPSIVQVHDFGVTMMPSGDLAPWMALEWMQGGTLEAELLHRRGRGGRTPAECLGLLAPVLDALVYAHKQGIAHRDIKPANIMLVETDHGAALKILDFGIAKIMGDEAGPGTGTTRTTSALVSFSPAYAAPEQITYGRTGPWTDVHAIALMLVEMLTDQPPFSTSDMTELCALIMDRDRPTPRAKGVDVGAWEPVLARALAVLPADRFKDATELVAALRASVRAVSSPYISIPHGDPPATAAAAFDATTHAPISAEDAPRLPMQRSLLKWIAVAAVAVVALGTGAFFATRPRTEARPSPGAAAAPGASTSAPAPSAAAALPIPVAPPSDVAASPPATSAASAAAQLRLPPPRLLAGSTASAPPPKGAPAPLLPSSPPPKPTYNDIK